jgi:hypothetical protein
MDRGKGRRGEAGSEVLCVVLCRVYLVVVGLVRYPEALGHDLGTNPQQHSVLALISATSVSIHTTSTLAGGAVGACPFVRCSSVCVV